MKHKRFCKVCRKLMKFEGTQRFTQLGYEYDLHTCYTETPVKCPFYGRTYAGSKRFIPKEG